MTQDGGRSLLRARCAQVVPALISWLAASPPLPSLGPFPLLTTGIGGSEGPARLLAALLQQQGLPARFVPLSSFAEASPAGRSLVIFSQGLSPNAHLALHRLADFERVLLVTGLTAEHPALSPLVERGLTVVTLESEDERGLLVRIVGPALASLAAMVLAGRIESPDPSRLRDALHRAKEQASRLGPLPPTPLALVASGEHTERCEGLRWRLVEGLLHPRIQLWDALALAHGPFQGFHTTEQTLLALEDGPLSAALIERLAPMLNPSRHRLLRLPATLEAPWCLLEHLVQLDALMVATLEETQSTIAPWPGQGEDGPLYELKSITCGKPQGPA